MRASLVLSLALSSLAACGGSSTSALCSKVQGALDHLSQAEAPCTSGSTTVGITAASCEASLPRCSDADKTVISQVADCLSALPTCSTATASAWVTQATTCTDKLKTISAACQQ